MEIGEESLSQRAEQADFSKVVTAVWGCQAGQSRLWRQCRRISRHNCRCVLCTGVSQQGSDNTLLWITLFFCVWGTEQSWIVPNLMLLVLDENTEWRLFFTSRKPSSFEFEFYIIRLFLVELIDNQTLLLYPWSLGTFKLGVWIWGHLWFDSHLLLVYLLPTLFR